MQEFVFTSNLTSSAMFTRTQWLNACDKQTYYKMRGTEIDPYVHPYIECVLHVNTSLPFRVIAFRMCYITYTSPYILIF